jgi:glycosyltransferase involved in cell wall biosynthesis
MHVLHLTATNARRGPEVFAYDLVRELAARGIAGDLRAVRGSSDRETVPIEALSSQRWSPLAFRRLRRLVGDADVAIAHGSSSLAALALVSRSGVETPFIYRGIGEPGYWLSSRARRLRSTAYLRRAARLTSVWEGSARQLSRITGVPLDQIELIPRGVAAADFPLTTPEARSEARARLGIPPLADVAVIVGSLTPEKRVDRALEVIARSDDVLLLVVGDGPQRAMLEAEAQRLGRGSVRFLGVQRDPRTAYAAADAQLLTSDTEGVPGVIIEAAFTGLPTVATAVGGTCVAVDHGRTGFLVPTDAPDLLAERLAQAIKERHALGTEARAHCLGQFELELIADRWEGLVRDVAERGR